MIEISTENNPVIAFLKFHTDEAYLRFSVSIKEKSEP